MGWGDILKTVNDDNDDIIKPFKLGQPNARAVKQELNTERDDALTPVAPVAPSAPMAPDIPSIIPPTKMSHEDYHNIAHSGDLPMIGKVLQDSYKLHRGMHSQGGSDAEYVTQIHKTMKELAKATSSSMSRHVSTFFDYITSKNHKPGTEVGLHDLHGKLFQDMSSLGSTLASIYHAGISGKGYFDPHEEHDATISSSQLRNMFSGKRIRPELIGAGHNKTVEESFKNHLAEMVKGGILKPEHFSKFADQEGLVPSDVDPSLTGTKRNKALIGSEHLRQLLSDKLAELHKSGVVSDRYREWIQGEEDGQHLHPAILPLLTAAKQIVSGSFPERKQVLGSPDPAFSPHNQTLRSIVGGISHLLGGYGKLHSNLKSTLRAIARTGGKSTDPDMPIQTMENHFFPLAAVMIAVGQGLHKDNFDDDDFNGKEFIKIPGHNPITIGQLAQHISDAGSDASDLDDYVDSIIHVLNENGVLGHREDEIRDKLKNITNVLRSERVVPQNIRAYSYSAKMTGQSRADILRIAKDKQLANEGVKHARELMDQYGTALKTGELTPEEWSGYMGAENLLGGISEAQETKTLPSPEQIIGFTPRLSYGEGIEPPEDKDPKTQSDPYNEEDFAAYKERLKTKPYTPEDLAIYQSRVLQPKYTEKEGQEPRAPESGANYRLPGQTQEVSVDPLAAKQRDKDRRKMDLTGEYHSSRSRLVEPGSAILNPAQRQQQAEAEKIAKSPQPKQQLDDNWKKFVVTERKRVGQYLSDLLQRGLKPEDISKQVEALTKQINEVSQQEGSPQLTTDHFIPKDIAKALREYGVQWGTSKLSSMMAPYKSSLRTVEDIKAEGARLRYEQEHADEIYQRAHTKETLETLADRSALTTRIFPSTLRYQIRKKLFGN